VDQLPPYELRTFRVTPPLSPEDFERRTRRNREARERGRVFRYGIPLGIVIAVLLLIASDFVPPLARFWREHQVVTSLLTGALLTLAAVFVLDRILSARNRKRWRLLGLMVCEKLEWGDVEEILALQVYAYVRRQTGAYPPEEADYLGRLPEALEDPDTWASPEGGLSMEEWLGQEKDELEGILTSWAPVLIAEPGLAAIADAATDLLTTIGHVKGALLFGEPKAPDEGVWDPAGPRWQRLLAAIHSHRYASVRMYELIDAYRAEG
jgi:hypothetical protein